MIKICKRYVLIKASIQGVYGQTKTICALKGSSVDLPCAAKNPTSSTKWFAAHWNGSMIVQNELPADGNRVTYNMSEESQPTLRINDLRESDGRSYCCEESVKLCWQNAIQLNVSGTIITITRLLRIPAIWYVKIIFHVQLSKTCRWWCFLPQRDSQ